MNPTPAPAHHPRPATDAWVARQLRRVGNQWPLLLVLMGVLVSCAIMSTGQWRRGALMFGGSVALAGLLRLVLPGRVVGLLAVRARWIDTLLLLVAAAGLLVLTVVVPASRPAR